MRQRFNPQPGLEIIPIEKILRPAKSRDELPPILAGLQWIWSQPQLQAQIFVLLELKVLAGKKPTGRTGLDLWHILVLGVVRLGLGANFDRLEQVANFDTLLRQILGLPPTPFGPDAKIFNHQTLRDNLALRDDALLQPINALVAAAGRAVFPKKENTAPEPLAIKVDTSVLETDVHFPTDLNLLHDAGRKGCDLIEKYRDQFGYVLPHWRKLKDWRRRLKACERAASQAVYRGGVHKETRMRAAVRAYLECARDLSVKIQHSLLALCAPAVEEPPWQALACFHGHLDKPIDLVDRRLLQGQTIPAAEKVFSLFEPHTEWIQKGKQRPNVELGHRLLIATDAHHLIHDYDVPVGGADVDQSVPVADRLLGRYGEGALASLSFDQGFTRAADRELLNLYIPEVVRPKRGKKERG